MFLKPGSHPVRQWLDRHGQKEKRRNVGRLAARWWRVSVARLDVRDHSHHSTLMRSAVRRASAIPVSIGFGDPICGNRAGPATYAFGTSRKAPKLSVTELAGSVFIHSVPLPGCVLPGRLASPAATLG